MPVNPSAEGLQRWYRTLDKLMERKEAIEQSLYLKLRDLFSLKAELVFIGGKLKAPEKIGAAAAQILARNHGHRYYGWELKEGKFHYFEHPNLEREKAYEGKYLIQTEEQNLSPVDAVTADKELSEVERAFRCLKDVIEMRPVYHRDDGRVQGHIFVAVLAFLLKRALEKKLKVADRHLSGEAALEALRTIHVVQMQLGTKRPLGVTTGSSRAREVLKALGITATSPPSFQGKTETTAHQCDDKHAPKPPILKLFPTQLSNMG